MLQIGRAKLKPKKETTKPLPFGSSSISPPPAAARARPWRASYRGPSRSPRARTSISPRPSAARRCSAPRRSSPISLRRRPRPLCSPGGGSRPPPRPPASRSLSRDSSLAYAASEGRDAGRRRRSESRRRTLHPRPRPRRAR